MDARRREILLATGALLGFAGCIDGSPGRTDDSTDDETGDDDDDNGNGNRTGDTDLEYEVFQLGASPAQPLWTTDTDATGLVTLLDPEDEYDDLWMIENLDERDGLQSWINETNIDTSTIVYVETAGPDTCYNRLDINDVAVENGKIVGTVEATDTGDQNETCGDAKTYLSAFVRVTADDLPSDAAFTVIDGWGASSEVSANGRYVDPAALPGDIRPSGDPAKLEALRCDEESFRRLQGPQAEAVAVGEAYNDEDLTFAMRVHTTQTLTGGEEGSLQVGRGHEVGITMQNVSTDVQVTGTRHKWNLQVLTIDGWKDVRGTTDGNPVGYDDLGIVHSPGEGFEWAFEMSEQGIVADRKHEQRLTVCPDLQPGRYRFVYWGIVSGEPLTVEFNYSG